jgi:hypothetical protein
MTEKPQEYQVGEVVTGLDGARFVCVARHEPQDQIPPEKLHDAMLYGLQSWLKRQGALPISDAPSSISNVKIQDASGPGLFIKPE